jgi:hypothetical protein
LTQVAIGKNRSVAMQHALIKPGYIGTTELGKRVSNFVHELKLFTNPHQER